MSDGSVRYFVVRSPVAGQLIRIDRQDRRALKEVMERAPFL